MMSVRHGAARLFQPSAAHGAFPPILYKLRQADVGSALPHFSKLTKFLETFVVRDVPGEKVRPRGGLHRSLREMDAAIRHFDYRPMMREVTEVSRACMENPQDRVAGAHMFLYRAVARHLASMYLHLGQYQRFHSNYDKTRNFLYQDFGLARDHVPEMLETLVLETEKATRGYRPEVDSDELLRQGKLSFVLAYPDYAVGYTVPGTEATNVHNIEPVAYMLGGESERYFKLMHLAVESKLGPLVGAAEGMINGLVSEERAVLLNAAADAARSTCSSIIKMPELSDPEDYLDLRFFIQGPYGSPSYPNGLKVRGVRLAPGGETGSQSSYAIIADLLSGVRFQFKQDSLSKMEEIHRVTREQATIGFVDSLREAAVKEQDFALLSKEERLARARLLQATNFYLLGHAAAYTIHVLAQQKSVVIVEQGSHVRRGKEDVATGGSAGSFLISKVIQRQQFLKKLTQDLDCSGCAYLDPEISAAFMQELENVKSHTEGRGREHGLKLKLLRELVNYSEAAAVGITPSG
eukprot:NODE_2724_length_2157_cov_8.309360.p1 GENE.NODE_2724_length_2157_cov_8.309360~~NODE_2724_length_2157_cov_8.309360.p1  ORF type:complete len:522 (-),score=133.92 NODE_2724_length_2157_cov_8.309360:581-2146(-)